uniref:beta-2-microglobulin-like n=1 Tax=Semicossyphus pulcher TaxID=241346 RepID=UPI0037E78843
MKFAVCVFVAALTAVTVYSSPQKKSPPKVQVYSVGPGEFGKENILICRVSGFYPPNLTLKLLKDEVELPGCNETDLTFGTNWHFHLARSVGFTPTQGEKYSCSVTHGSNTNNYAWEPNM